MYYLFTPSLTFNLDGYTEPWLMLLQDSLLPDSDEGSRGIIKLSEIFVNGIQTPL